MNFIKVLSFIVGLTLLTACKNQSVATSKVEAERIAIDKEIQGDTSISSFIEPYKQHLNKTLDSTLAYNPTNLSKSDGHLNTALGNLMADIVIKQGNPIFNKRTGKNIDMALLNHGGIRATLNKGNISTRSAYALMPFENEIVVAELKGTKMLEMLDYLEEAKTAHPVSGTKIVMDKNYKVIEAIINGKEIDTSETYFVATSDYLQQGGDNMNFFKAAINIYKLDYKLRNAIIDYFKKTDTIKTRIDNRFFQKKQSLETGI